MSKQSIRILFVCALAAAIAPLGATTPSDPLFDPSILHEIRITMAPEDWESMHVNYMDNTYYRCSVSWNGLTLDDVGMKQRGTSSRSPVKPGFKLSFGNYVSGQKFLGLKSLVVRNLVQEGSMSNERLSLALFARLSLPAPRTSPARVYVNGEYVGLHLLVEDMNKDFLSRQFGENAGWLYEFEWKFPYRFEYLGPDPDTYSWLWTPSTREDDPDGATLERMVRTVNEASDAEFESAASDFFDLEKVAMYLAVDSFLTEGDGFLADWGMNNLYMYRFQDGTVFQFIPWDKNATFNDPSVDIWHNTADNVFARRLLAVPRARRAFLETLLACAELSADDDSWLGQEIALQYRQVREAALADPYKPFTNEEFEQYQAGLPWFAYSRSAFVKAAVAAEWGETSQPVTRIPRPN
jgi:spore coat protein CotH